MTQVPLDIETIPAQPEAEVKAAIAETIQPPAAIKKQETIDDWHAGEGKYEGDKVALIEKKYRDTSFDGAKGQICSIAWAGGLEAEPFSLFATPGERSEADILMEFFTLIRGGNSDRPAYFIGHYLPFDLPFIYQRAVVLGINPGFDLHQFGRHPHDYFDCMPAWAGWKGTISQDNLCAALGIDIPGPEGLEGATVWDFYKRGEFELIEKYNRVDVAKVQANYKRLTFA